MLVNKNGVKGSDFVHTVATAFSQFRGSVFGYFTKGLFLNLGLSSSKKKKKKLSANGTEAHATIQRIVLPDTIHPMCAHTYQYGT